MDDDHLRSSLMFSDGWVQSFWVFKVILLPLPLVTRRFLRRLWEKQIYIELSVWMAPLGHVIARTGALMTAAFHWREMLRASLFWRFLRHRIEISCCWFYSFRLTCFDKTRSMLCKLITQNGGWICFPGSTEQLKNQTFFFFKENRVIKVKIPPN